MMKSKLMTTVVTLLLAGSALSSANTPAAIKHTGAEIAAIAPDSPAAAAAHAAVGQNVSVHARVKCKPVAGLYENPDTRRKIRNLPFGQKIGYRGDINSEWARVEVYGAPSEGRWGFMRRACVGSFNSW